MSFNWIAFFAPVLQALLKGLIDLVWELVEEWASGRETKPTSTEKKNMAVALAKDLGVGDELTDGQLDTAIEMVHTAKQKVYAAVDRPRVGKSAAQWAT